MHWVIGDVHGMLRPLEALLGAISRRDPAARLIFAGDYVNRGPDSRRVIDRLLTLEHATFLRGNHDDIFDLLLSGDCYICHTSAPDPLSAFTWFMQHGLAETLMSYGCDWAELEYAQLHPTPKRVAQVVSAVPEAHREFVHSLRPVFEGDTFFVAHGYWDPDARDESPSITQQLSNDPQLRYRLLWHRFTQAQISGRKRWRRTGYFGHTPVFNYPAGADFEPVRGPGIALLDTAVALSAIGVLTAVCVESGITLRADRAGETAELP